MLIGVVGRVVLLVLRWPLLMLLSGVVGGVVQTVVWVRCVGIRGVGVHQERGWDGSVVSVLLEYGCGSVGVG